MRDEDKTKEQLLVEVETLRRRIAELEASEDRRGVANGQREQVAATKERDRIQAVLKATIECLPFEFFAIGSDGRYMLQNATLRDHYGNALGKRPEDYAPDEITRELWLDNNRRAFAGERVEGEVQIPVGGQICHFYNILTPIQDANECYGILGVNIDITERKRAEEALKESERRYRTLLDTLPLVVYEYDVNGVVTLVNAASRTISGYEPDEVVGTTLWDRMESEEEKGRAQAYLRHLVTEQPPPTPYFGRSRAKDGRQIDTRVDWNYLRDDRGELTGFVCAATDITERKQAEEALQEAHAELERRVEQRTAELLRANEELAIFRKFAETSSQGFSMADLDGRLIYLNPALCRMLGDVKAEDYVGQHLSICYSEETNYRGRKEIEPALKQNGYWEGELPLLSRQGKSIPTWHHGFVIQDEQGRPLRFAVVITDIAERKRAEEALRESEEKYRTLVETSPDAILMTDLTGRVTFASRQALQMYGTDDPQDLLGRNPLDFFAPQDHPKVLAALERPVEEARTKEVEYRLLRKDGTSFVGEVSAAPVKDMAGSPMGFVAIVRDVTARRQAEEALERERRTLGHLFRSSDHERQLIAYDIHDGLAQYLAGAIMQFDTFAHLKETKPKEAAKAYEAGMTMLRQGHGEARRLISGVRPPILDEAGVVVAISHLIHEQRQPKGPKIEFHSLVEFDRLVAIQENTIYRIVQEALTNACKYSKSERVRVEIVQQGDKVRIEVQDWGVGFDPAKVDENCFGLEGIRERTRLLGGTSTIESAPDKGTRIGVELPLAIREEYQ